MRLYCLMNSSSCMAKGKGKTTPIIYGVESFGLSARARLRLACTIHWAMPNQKNRRPENLSRSGGSKYPKPQIVTEHLPLPARHPAHPGTDGPNQ